MFEHYPDSRIVQIIERLLSPNAVPLPVEPVAPPLFQMEFDGSGGSLGLYTLITLIVFPVARNGLEARVKASIPGQKQINPGWNMHGALLTGVIPYMVMTCNATTLDVGVALGVSVVTWSLVRRVKIGSLSSFLVMDKIADKKHRHNAARPDKY